MSLKSLAKYILRIPSYAWCLLWIPYYMKKSGISEIIVLDAKRMVFEQQKKYSNLSSIVDLFLESNTCFRDVFYWRCKYKSYFLQWFFKRYPCLLFDGKMKAEGGAFFFHHPFSTVINAQYVGYGCTFRNNTTIGNKKKNGEIVAPIIIGGADFGVNSCVIGGITIGKNVTIGAGSVVVKDVPNNAVIAGNPPKLIKMKNEKNTNIIHT